MKARLFVVDANSLIETNRTNIAYIRIPELVGDQWLKTVADMMADMLQIEIGDYIFLWETKSESQKSRIHGVYRVISRPYYECSAQEALFKIHIEKAYDFELPVEEYEVLINPYINNSLWTIVGKKVAGKPRGTTPLSMEEADYLIKLLIGKNETCPFIEYNPSHNIQVDSPLHISYGLSGVTERRNREALDPETISFFDESYNVKFEKVLETIFNQELTNRNESVFVPLGIDVNKVVWYSNYLPYSVAQNEMDYVVMESKDQNTITDISLIEFLKTSIDEAHIKKACNYSKWLNLTQGLGLKFSRPIIICQESVDFLNGENNMLRSRKLNRLEQLIISLEQEYDIKPLEIYVYNITSDGITFTRKR